MFIEVVKSKLHKVTVTDANLQYCLLYTSVFFSLMRTTQEVTTSSVADFNIGKYTFEIGGKNKAQKQIEGIENAYVVKDDIEYGYKNIIPLWAFGLTY